MKYLFSFILCFVIWLLLTAEINFEIILIGIIISFITTILFSQFATNTYLKILSPIRIFWALIYIPVFLFECLKANLDVAYRVINPNLPIKPGIVKVRTNLKTNKGKTLLANSITLTPGTLTVEIINDFLYIHWINVKSTNIDEATNYIVKKFEKYIKRIVE
ncbi:MAG TPA: Na+/H+ antiporter subunit E [bacterium]|nr:Na+/H+ antiporter subunit E [bacterium]